MIIAATYIVLGRDSSARKPTVRKQVVEICTSVSVLRVRAAGDARRPLYVTILYRK